MRWRTERRSTNIEDRRSSGYTGGGVSRIPGGRATGIGGIGLIIVLVVVLALGGDPGAIIGSTEYSPGSYTYQSQLSQEQQDELADHVALVLGDTETTWALVFEDQLGKTYEEPRLVLFTGTWIRPAERPVQQWGRSTVLPTRRCTSTLTSSTSCSRSTRPPATLPRPT